MTVYYVSTTGNNNNSGSSSAPWKTISYAVAQNLKAGDEVIVRDGTYNEAVSITKGGSASGYVTIKAEHPGEALIRPPAGYGYSVNVGANYVVLDGFDIKGPTVEGHGVQVNYVHHVKVINNIVHDSGASGIQFNWADFVTIEGNETYNNARLGWFSGISIYENRAVNGTGDTSEYRTIVRNNISHDNFQTTGLYTDGNGIIIDDFNSTHDSNYQPYTYKTLVEGNVVYSNGGKGIAVHWSNYVTARNNTAWHNNTDNKNTATWRGEFSQQDSSHNTWVNNIAVADPSVNKYNTAIGFYGSNSDSTWVGNLTYNGTAGQASVNVQGGNSISASTNRLGVDPQFVNPAAGDFHLKGGSPAINSGTSAYGLATVDADGNVRVVGTVDMGAYEYGSGGGGTTNRAPVANNDSGFTTKAGVALTIDDAALLANDTDADGNALKISAVSGASNGTVAINANGDVVFTPKAGYSGAAGFTYTASDGQGGTDTATVALTVQTATTTNRAPVANNDSGFTTKAGVALTIDDAALLANDTDADGNALKISAVSGASNGTVAINANGDVVFTPKAGYSGAAGFTYTASDGQGGTDTATVALTVQSATTTDDATSFFAASARPATTETSDPTRYELGMRFRTTEDGEITGLRYYRGSADASDTDTRTLNLWSSTGTKLASGTITSTSGKTGWQTVELSKAVDVTAGKTYTVSYGTTKNYAYTENYFNSSKTSADGLITALWNGGVFKAGGTGGYPTQTYNKANYWADVVFDPDNATATTSTAAADPEPSAAGKWLFGTEQADTLIGGAGDDTIVGGKGYDRIIGAGGADRLSGGAGDDTFVYRSVGESAVGAHDTIVDFVRGDDRIDVSRIDAVEGGGNDAFAWKGSAAFSGTAGELRSQSTASGLMLQGDTDGDGHADFQVALNAGYHGLFASNLVL